MKSRLHRIEIRNFKAFREFTLDLEGRHLLVYGPNGSGKSSLYWALYTFLQSAQKPAPEVAKYFDPNHDEKLLNIHEQLEATPKGGEIAVTLRDTSTNADTHYCISQTVHQTHRHPIIEKGNRASDFVTYRFFFGFSDFRNSERFNVWPLFEREILPFCRTTSGQNLLEMWHRISHGNPNPWSYRGQAGRRAYDEFRRHTEEFAYVLPGIVDPISRKAQEFYDQHFSSDDPAKVTLRLGVASPPTFIGRNQSAAKFKIPEIEFGIQIGGQTVSRPQSFLNEAKLTQLALSVRFAASLVNLRESDLKLLVLDDLLVSLDMSNRMKVVEILLSETFADYQKVVLTHELGFFQEFKRLLARNHNQWMFGELAGNAKDGLSLRSVKSDMEIAEEYLARGQLAECGNRLRKAVEENLEQFLTAARQSRGLDPLFTRGKFPTLHQRICEAQAVLGRDSWKELVRLLQSNFSTSELAAIVSPNEIDPSQFTAANNQEKGRIIGKLMAARPALQQVIVDALSEASRKQLTAINLLEEVARIKDRILNPASHSGITPIYTAEAENAVNVIQSLNQALSTALSTL